MSCLFSCKEIFQASPLEINKLYFYPTLHDLFSLGNVVGIQGSQVGNARQRYISAKKRYREVTLTLMLYYY